MSGSISSFSFDGTEKPQTKKTIYEMHRRKTQKNLGRIWTNYGNVKI
jgi:hypothetical protein